MGNEVSRPSEDLSPQNSGAVPKRSPYTPTGRAQSFSTRSPSPSPAAREPVQRRISSSSSLGANPNGSNPKKERTIQRMDKAIRRRVRGGITYNMKLLLRGAKGTGKTSLFHRLKGDPIPETHQSTPQLQSATINWSFRQNLEENVKCEVWDVVDRGFIPVDDEEGADGPNKGSNRSQQEHGGLQSGGSLTAEATAAAAAAAAAMQNGTHSVAIVDASTVDVYHEAHGVIFLLDVTKWDTLEYVKQQLDNVPVHIPTLVLGNFRDQGAKRKIFKEDIQELLYGSSDRPQTQQWRRPTELLYFECSLQNCYGLKSLHQYFGIPFLQLKLATIRQQMRIVEGEFAHLKHDVQATISEQRYAEYIEHIKATGSDIRTGRRGSGNGNTPPEVSRNNSVRLSPKEGTQAKPEVGADDDVSVVSKENGVGAPAKQATSVVTAAAEILQQEQEIKSQDMEDLPARNSSAVIQAAPPLKFEHKESAASIPDGVAEVKVDKVEDKPAQPEAQSSKTPAVTNPSPSRPRKASVEEVMHLEDFQVPKARISDLDHFYSEDESDEDGGHDEDVVVGPVGGSMKASITGVYHKQRFLDSDSDSDESESVGTQRRRKEKVSRKSSPLRKVTKQASATGQTVPKPPQPSPSPPSPHPPTSVSPPKQRSRPGSPIRSQSSSPVKDSKDVTGEALSQHPQSSSPASDAALPTPPAAPPTSSPASPVRHLSPRNKSENPVAESHPETRVSLSQHASELKRDPFSGEEPELTGTEVATESIVPDAQTSLKSSIEREELKNAASTKNAHDDGVVIDAVAPHVSGEEIADRDTSNSTEEDVKNEPEDVVGVPTYGQEHVQGGCIDVDTMGDGLAGSSNELNNFLADEDEDDDDAPTAVEGNGITTEQTVEEQLLEASSSSPRRPEVLGSDDDNDSDEDGKRGPTEVSLSSLQSSLPMPQSSAPSFTSQGQEEVRGHYHKRNLDGADDLLSLSSLQASLPLPDDGVGPSSEMPMDNSNGGHHSGGDSALNLSDLQTNAATSKPIVPDFTTVVPSNDLEAFLNESDSDSEHARLADSVVPGGQVRPTTRGTRAMVESSDDDDEEDQDRFASYSISKKSRSERRRQQKEDLRQLNAALDKSSAGENDSFTSSASGVAASNSSFGTSDVMEAIRKAQEEAMRMLPTEPTPVDNDADYNSSKKRHKHKHKKREGGDKEKSSKKSSRKPGSSSRSKKRRPHVEDDLM